MRSKIAFHIEENFFVSFKLFLDHLCCACLCVCLFDNAGLLDTLYKIVLMVTKYDGNWNMIRLVFMISIYAAKYVYLKL